MRAPMTNDQVFSYWSLVISPPHHFAYSTNASAIFASSVVPLWNGTRYRNVIVPPWRSCARRTCRLLEIVQAERIGGEQSVRPHVPSRGEAEARRMIEDRDAERFRRRSGRRNRPTRRACSEPSPSISTVAVHVLPPFFASTFTVWERGPKGSFLCVVERDFTFGRGDRDVEIDAPRSLSPRDVGPGPVLRTPSCRRVRSNR